MYHHGTSGEYGTEDQGKNVLSTYIFGFMHSSYASRVILPPFLSLERGTILKVVEFFFSLQICNEFFAPLKLKTLH